MRKIILHSTLIILLVISCLLIIFWWQIRTPLNPSGGNIIFKVEKGDSAKVIADHLVNAGLIKNTLAFRWYVFLSGDQYALKSGEYELSSKMSIRDIADTLVFGGANEVLVTIPEGFNLKQIEESLIEAGLAKPDEILKFKFSQNIPPILSDKPKTASLEGYLFPDTYRFFKDAKLPDIISKMVNNLNKKLTPDLQSAIKNSPYNSYQILTIASLVEKEVANDSDRPIVAGILWKRLKAGVPLQVDATLIYVTGRNTIYEADKKIKSPYNTYLYSGLPKGPIDSPGLSAIRAAIFPVASPYWYYLSAKDGKTIFSKTLEEHNYNRAKYLK